MKRSLTSLVYILLVSILLAGFPPAVAQGERRADGHQGTYCLAAAQASPSPSPSPAPRVAVTPARTLQELQARIAEILEKPELSSAMVGIKVVSLDTNKVLFEENANKLLRPASNMKLYTVAAALDRLSPDYRFSTSVYAPMRPDSTGVVRGDLTIYGRGDPSIAARFNNGDYLKAIDDLATRIAGAGVKRVEGDIVGDESYFVGPKYGAGWNWEDLTWYYGAEITSLTINDNALDLFIKPGPAVGQPAVITTGPPDPLLTIVNKVITSTKGVRREISIHRGLGENSITITGTIPLEDRGYSGGIGISHPALLFVYLLRTSLAQKGVVITGKSRTKGETSQPVLMTSTAVGATAANPFQNEIAILQSPPFSVIASQTLKPSQNLYTELILRTLGKVTPPPATTSSLGQTSEELGIEAVKSFLKTVGIRPEALNLDDGSGLSRNDMITAEASVQLLTFMSKHRYATVFRDALPIGGVDGTLRNRFRGTPAENNVRAKTGSLSSAASLGGYVTTAAGEKLAFSIMVNNYPRDIEPRSLCIDPIAILLASFAGKPE
ncbi:MAG TPA: D-alanyl-D-alanine carboxypeptidase/D-alanyl-D-alanine-endopeptidase [Pyrinomonadaceae bacterium]|jgi:D-alanyl-D-alanine carboxypeptidase/D-alanyl-D-alanine-endopeptidase (penicillin-binding protein 4)|nr:D-alanyl-D-alanine carboxypeptidase/D-alanyl-D-alanine-endopeptidase [Pyrinomonadaceae bacterium]